MTDAATTLTLVVEKGPKKGESIECRSGRTVRIGRVVRGNTFSIKDPAISEKHVFIEALGGREWCLSDLDTSNGTFLNGRQIEPLVPTKLSHGDTIKIGAQTSITVRISGFSDQAEAEAEEVKEPPARRRGKPRRQAEPTTEASTVRQTRGAARREAAEAAKVGDLDGGREADLEEKEHAGDAAAAKKQVGVRKGRGVPRRGVPNAELGDLDGEKGADMEEKECAGGAVAEKKQVGTRKGRVVPRRGVPNAESGDLDGEREADMEEKECAGGAVAEEKECAGGAVAEEKQVGTRKGRGVSRKGVPNVELLEDDAGVDRLKRDQSGLRRSHEPSVVSIKEEVAAEDATREVVVSSLEDGNEVCPLDKEVEGVGCGMDVPENLEEHVEVRAIEEKIDMENMTLGQWFDRLEIALPMMINDVAEEVIAEIQAKADKYRSYMQERCKSG